MNKVKKTRRPRGTGTPKVKVVTKLTAEQYPSMHEYCLTQDDIDSQRRYQRKRDLQTGNVYIPKTPMVPVCEHPEQGFCSHDQPTPSQLAAINARLAHRTSGGVPITDELIEKLSQEAERGYDLKKLKPKKIPRLKGHGFSELQAKATKKRKYTKKPGVVYGRPKK